VLKTDPAFEAFVGPTLKQWYLSVKEVDLKAFKKMPEEERRRRYLELF
jgi:hypothetical protein